LEIHFGKVYSKVFSISLRFNAKINFLGIVGLSRTPKLHGGFELCFSIPLLNLVRVLPFALLSREVSFAAKRPYQTVPNTGENTGIPIY
jgi:hypothetical protein